MLEYVHLLTLQYQGDPLEGLTIMGMVYTQGRIQDSEKGEGGPGKMLKRPTSACTTSPHTSL